MKSMQRKFGKLMKQSADQQDVGVVLAEFKAMDEMLDRLIRDLTTYRNAWEDILKLAYDTSEAFAYLYKPLDPPKDPDSRIQPAQTPAKYMQKCLGLQKLYSDLQADLQTEIGMITTKLLAPLEEAKKATKVLQKTRKHRENMKLDYERYLSRAEHARKKEQRTAKEEVALQGHENNLAQAQIDYETADDQVKQTFPPVTAAVISLLPYIMTSQVMLQTTLVGQVYTSLDEYTKKFRLPNPAPSDGEIVEAWEREFTGFRKELEEGIATIANGKAVKMGMALPADKGPSMTGLGIRNKAGGLMHRKGSAESGAGGGGGSMTGLGIRNKVGGAMHGKDSGHGGDGAGGGFSGGMASMRQGIGARMGHSSPSATTPSAASPSTPSAGWERTQVDEEEAAPPKPPRPGQSSGFPSDIKSRIPSGISNQSGRAPYDQHATALTPNWPSNPPPTYEQASAGAASPPSRYATPVNGNSPSTTTAVNTDYFPPSDNPWARRTSQASSSAMSAAAAKKKPPPIPVKRFPSSQQAQYVTAIYDFEGQSEGDVAFREGDQIKVIKKTESTDDWWDGEVDGRVGAFPANYVRV